MSRERALIVGCHGGVGRAVLALLQQTRPGRRLCEGLEAVLLVDRDAAESPVRLDGGELLPPANIASADDLGQLVRDHRVTQVIDLASTDTVDCTQLCDRLGAHYLCTSVEEWPDREPRPTDEAIARLLPPQRQALTRQSHLVGSGANPGIVNALAFTAVERLAARAGLAPSVEALGVYGLYITEEDTTIEQGAPPRGDVFPMTWSPARCLEEIFEPRAFAASGGRVISLGHEPTDGVYSARCGRGIIEGFVVPHDEVVTLAQRLPSVEIAFIYRMPPGARRVLDARPPGVSWTTWSTRRLYPPWTAALVGQDRVGVLVCTRRFGELWIGFETDVAAGLRLGTNATQLQVAAGVLAGWSQLGRRRGIHFVEDLDCDEFVRTAAELLGPPMVIHDPEPSVGSLLPERRGDPLSVVLGPQRLAD